MMRVFIGSTLIITSPTAEIEKWIKLTLTVDNPDYIKKERMGKWTGNTPRTLSLYAQTGNDYEIPFGCLKDVWKMYPVKEAYELKISDLRRLEYQSNINLYPYQERAASQAILAKNGIVVMPCGSGKTQTALEIIARIGGRALWLTHTQELLNQSKKRAEEVFEIEGKNVFGTISEGRVSLGTHITFATVQTMSNINLSDYRDYWDIVVVDESQHCCGAPTRVTQFYKVVNSLCARYKFGLTATPKRADGLECTMFSLLGDQICEVTREDVKDTTCPIRVVQEQTFWTPDYNAVLTSDGTIDYSKLIVEMTKDERRMEIVEDMTYECAKTGPTMVLANRVEYLQKMCDDFNKNQCGTAMCLSGMGQSKKAKAERKKALNALNVGELDCIFCTYQLAAEGLDVPNLRYVIFATPEKNEVTVTQAAGRVGRKAEGKERGTVIDFIDDFGMYKGWAKDRLRFYKKIDAEIY